MGYLNFSCASFFARWTFGFHGFEIARKLWLWHPVHEIFFVFLVHQTNTPLRRCKRRAHLLLCYLCCLGLSWRPLSIREPAALHIDYRCLTMLHLFKDLVDWVLRLHNFLSPRRHIIINTCSRFTSIVPLYWNGIVLTEVKRIALLLFVLLLIVGDDRINSFFNVSQDVVNSVGCEIIRICWTLLLQMIVLALGNHVLPLWFISVSVIVSECLIVVLVFVIIVDIVVTFFWRWFRFTDLKSTFWLRGIILRLLLVSILLFLRFLINVLR